MAKAKAKTFEVWGEFRYARVFPQNRDKEGPKGSGWDKVGGMYTVDIIVDKENANIIRDSGSALKIRSNMDKGAEFLEDGQYLVRFRRAHEHKIADFAGPPVVELADGTTIDPAEGIGVGNGSKGYLQFTVYETELQNGTRLEGIQVIEWHQYPLATGHGAAFAKRGETTIVEADVEDEDEDEVEEPVKTTKKKSTSAKKVDMAEDLDDEIPL